MLTNKESIGSFLYCPCVPWFFSVVRFCAQLIYIKMPVCYNQQG